MTLTMTLLTILSGVCLLLWGLRTVKRAVLRGYGAQVQSAIAYGTRNRITAVFCGIFSTLLLQSSAAATVLTASFVGRGLMTVATGLAVVIGADIGTSLVAKVLSFDLGWVGPFLLSVGIIFHLIYDDGSRHRFLARILLGIGFIIMGLGIVRETATNLLEHSETLPLILSPLSSEPILAILIAVILTYLMHSSLSTILIFATLAGEGVISFELALTFMIGVNIGAGVIPLMAVLRDVPQAVQIPLGNIIMRIVIGICVLFTLPILIPMIQETIPFAVPQQIVMAHIGFNILLAIAFLPFTGILAKLCGKIVPVLDNQDDPLKPRYLDKKALSSPSLALSCATRETLHMAEVLETMLKKSYSALADNNEKLIFQIKEGDQRLDALFAAIKDYIIHLSREELDDKEAVQSMRIMNFATNLEHCGDIIDTSLMDLALGKTKRQGQFSDEGKEEIKSIHEKVVQNLQLAQNIFLSSDPTLAKQLLTYKKGLKLAEVESAANHMKRLQKGIAATVSTSGTHMDVIRDYRRINTYATSVAYDVLGDGAKD